MTKGRKKIKRRIGQDRRLSARRKNLPANKKIGLPDKFFLSLVLILVFIGLVAIASAGVVVAQLKFNDPYYYFKHQLFLGVIPGLIVMFVLSKINYHWWKKFSLFFLLAGLVLLLLVLISNYGLELKGARRWINFGFISFQPIELVKLFLIIYFAAWLSKKGKTIKKFSDSFVPFVFVLGAVSVLIALQPDIGSLGLVVLISLAMFFLAGGSLKHISLLVMVMFLVLLLLIKIEPYRMNRLLVFINPETDVRGVGWQVKQAAIAIGNGGIFGLGLGHSHQKFNYLPEVVGDSIFAIIAEELGLVGVTIILSLYLALVFRGFRLARRAPDRFAAYLILGISLWILLQALINIMAISGLMPLTGITLPFISYGSTSIISLLAGVGIVLNISRFVKK